MTAAAETKPEEDTVLSEDQKDRIHFLINNISPDSLHSKAKELLTLLNKDAYTWFANYLVVKRVSIEPNFHSLYLSLLQSFQSSDLITQVCKATYANVRILLASEKIKTSTSERSLLKHLGTWLGALTLRRNKPILQKNLDLKALIIDAYKGGGYMREMYMYMMEHVYNLVLAYVNWTGKMIAVIPFVSKILEHAKDSKVFKPPNPWLMSIVSMMAEIYGMPDLKLNLKFEIEMLTKQLSLDLSGSNNAIESSSVLSQMDKETQDNPDFNIRKDVKQQRHSASQSKQVSPPSPYTHTHTQKPFFFTTIF